MFVPVSLFLYGLSVGDLASGIIYLFGGLGVWWWLGGWMDKEHSPQNVPATTLECVWCGDMFQPGEKKMSADGSYGIRSVQFGEPAERFDICGYCYEGLLSIRARGGDEKVVHAVLREAKQHPDVQRGRGFNDFIYAANQISN